MPTPLRRTSSLIRGLARLVVTVAMLVAAAAPGRAQVRDSADVARIIIALERTLQAGLGAADTLPLQQIIAPQFAVTRSSSTATAFESRLQWMTEASRARTTAIEVRGLMVRVFARRPPWHVWPDMAICSFIVTQRVQAAASIRVETVAITDVWRFTGAHWVAVARSVSVPAAGHASTGTTP
jgi:hypothetical protein